MERWNAILPAVSLSVPPSAPLASLVLSRPSDWTSSFPLDLFVPLSVSPFPLLPSIERVRLQRRAGIFPDTYSNAQVCGRVAPRATRCRWTSTPKPTPLCPFVPSTAPLVPLSTRRAYYSRRVKPRLGLLRFVWHCTNDVVRPARCFEYELNTVGGSCSRGLRAPRFSLCIYCIYRCPPRTALSPYLANFFPRTGLAEGVSNCPSETRFSTKITVPSMHFPLPSPTPVVHYAIIARSTAASHGVLNSRLTAEKFILSCKYLRRTLERCGVRKEDSAVREFFFNFGTTVYVG